MVSNSQILGACCHEWKSTHPADADLRVGCPTAHGPDGMHMARWVKTLLARSWKLTGVLYNNLKRVASHLEW